MNLIKESPKPSCRLLGVLMIAAATVILAGAGALIGVLA